MLLAAVAHLRFAASVVFGWPLAPWSLDQLLAGLLAGEREFGPPDAQEAELLIGPTLDDATRRELQARRVRALARRAAAETAYYGRTLADYDLARLSFADLAMLPLTTKSALRAAPDAFVARTARPVARLTTTGTTGAPTVVYFSAHELTAYVTLTALGCLVRGSVTPEDIVVVATSVRAYLGNLCTAGACARIGALVDTVGMDQPAVLLQRLAERRRIAGKKDRVSVLQVYPSYLGQLVEVGRALGYRPDDFGLERMILGGEIASAGLLERSRELFGEVAIEQGYGMTEVWPVGGSVCEQQHLHFEPTHGLTETVDPETLLPARPDALASLVVTPFPPFRDTTLLLRYDTEDLVAPLGSAPLTCSLRTLPATGQLLGKRRLSVRHAGGWTCPRHMFEALEALEEVPLPARCGFWAEGPGVAVEIVARHTGEGVRKRIADALEANGVPLRALAVHDDARALRRPFPLRGDLREAAFEPPPVAPMPAYALGAPRPIVDALEI